MPSSLVEAVVVCLLLLPRWVVEVGHLVALPRAGALQYQRALLVLVVVQIRWAVLLFMHICGLAVAVEYSCQGQQGLVDREQLQAHHLQQLAILDILAHLEHPRDL